MIKARWYFDFISPFAYLQLHRFDDLPEELEIELRPILFAGLLKHWGQLGPAEIPPKRRFIYRFFQWQADQLGVPFVMPPAHPFNPLPALRLALAAGPSVEVATTIFDHIFGQGRAPDTEDGIAAMAERLGIADVQASLADPSVKDALRRNTDEAIQAGAFGVPTFVVNDEVFWGNDATGMLLSYLESPGLFTSGEMARVSDLPLGMTRKI